MLGSTDLGRPSRSRTFPLPPSPSGRRLSPSSPRPALMHSTTAPAPSASAVELAWSGAPGSVFLRGPDFSRPFRRCAQESGVRRDAGERPDILLLRRYIRGAPCSPLRSHQYAAKP
ncbi:hypothetical protein PVAP13_7KG122800 [Panicum virgatum]|uniref:Uncharacterized protein n=1 Tax=Panicum virgatum TaxID=38727 RepID=A0A8T0QFJ6_PANVG|nr:hypothetical protein PVAP13_7KG122800 [Panicum virgatum]